MVSNTLQCLSTGSNDTRGSTSLAMHHFWCRVVTWEELSRATDRFSDSRRLSSSGAGDYYRGSLDNEAVAVWVPHRRDLLSWQQVKFVADRMANVNSRHLVPLEAVTRDGCAVYKLMLVRLSSAHWKGCSLFIITPCLRGQVCSCLGNTLPELPGLPHTHATRIRAL